MSFEKALPVITLLIGFIGGYLLTLISDRRKLIFESKKELRISYAKWYSLQKTIFSQLESVINYFSKNPNDIEKIISLKDQFLNLQANLGQSNQHSAEILLLENHPISRNVIIDFRKSIYLISGIIDNMIDVLEGHISLSNRFFKIKDYKGKEKKSKENVKYLVELDAVENELSDMEKGIKDTQIEIQSLNSLINELEENTDIFFQSLAGKF